MMGGTSAIEGTGPSGRAVDTDALPTGTTDTKRGEAGGNESIINWRTKTDTPEHRINLQSFLLPTIASIRPAKRDLKIKVREAILQGNFALPEDEEGGYRIRNKTPFVLTAYEHSL